MTVTDAVPAGVVVDPTSISDGGVLSGASAATGAGGTVSWTIPGPVDPGASVPLTYAATLAPSTGLTTAAQVNQADVTGYDSLPSGGRTLPGHPDGKRPGDARFPVRPGRQVHSSGHHRLRR